MPSSRSSSATIASSYGEPPVSSVTSGKPAPPGKPASARSARAASGSWTGSDVAIAPARDARRDHRRRHAVGVGHGQDGDPPPVDGGRERLADADVVERRRGWCRSRSSRSTATAPRAAAARGRVVGDPGGVELGDGRVVELALLERLDRARATEVGDDGDLADGRRSRPVARVGRQGHRRSASRR